MNEAARKSGLLARTAATKSGRMLLGACMTLLFVGLTAAVFPILFLTNDDASIMYTFAGYYTGEPYPVHGFVNLPLGYLTGLLYMLLPTVPWWPVLQLLCVAISIWVIFYSLWDVGAANGIPAWAMALTNALLYATVLVYAVWRISFTLTACMLGTAGILRLLSANTGGERREPLSIYAMIESLSLMIFCFLFRNSTGYSMVCFWAVGVAYHALNYLMVWKKPERRKELLRLGAYAVGCLMVFGALVWLNGWSYQNMNPVGYAAFEDARGRYQDFPHVTYAEDPAFFASLGWDEEIYNLVERYCYIDPHVTADSLNAILAYDTGETGSIVERFSAALRYGEAFFRGNGPAEYMLVAPVLLAFWAFFWFLREKKRGVETLAVLGLALGSFLLCLYLCFVERLILRAFQVIAIPAAVMMLLLCLRMRGETHRRAMRSGAKLMRAGLIGLAALALCWSLAKSWFWMGQFEPEKQIRDMRAAEAYAMEHEQNVYLYMPTFIYNNEAFKTYPAEKPLNMLDWGDTGMYSGWKTRQLEQNGIAPLTPGVFARDNVYLMGTLEGQELQVLFDYLMKDAGAKGFERIDAFGEGYAIYKVVY